MFTGEFHHTVDEKGRVAIPARFRAELAGGAWVSKWMDGCLAVHTRGSWEALAAKALLLPLSDADARTFKRAIFGTGFEIDFDGQGRFVIPPTLRAFAGLEGTAVVVGTIDHLELWSPARWATYSDQMNESGGARRAAPGSRHLGRTR